MIFRKACDWVKGLFTPKNPKTIYLGFTIEDSKIVRAYINARIKSFTDSKLFKNFFFKIIKDPDKLQVTYIYKVQIVYPYYASILGVTLILINILSFYLLGVRFDGGLVSKLIPVLLIFLGIILILYDLLFRQRWFFKILHKANFSDILNYKGYYYFISSSWIRKELEGYKK